MIQELKTSEEFKFFTKNNPFVIIHFWAEWNATDYLTKNIFQKLDSELNNQILFGLIDVDNEIFLNLCKEIPILNVPTIIYFKNGETIAIEIGLKTKEYFQEKINKLLDY